MNCKDLLLLIPDYLDNTLSHDRKKDFEQHMSSCPRCEAEVAQYRKLEDSLRSLDFDKVPDSVFIPALEAMEREFGKKESLFSRIMASLRTFTGSQKLATAGVLALLVIGFSIYQLILKSENPSEIARVSGNDTLIATKTPAEKKFVATLLVLEGTVEMKGDMNETWTAVNGRIETSKNVSFRTGENSKASLNYNNEATITLESSTSISIMAESNRGYRLERGKTFNNVIKGNGQFHIETPSATIRVMGTSFEVTVSTDNSTKVLVIEGIVRVQGTGSGEARMLGQGQQVLVLSTGKFQSPVPVTTSSATGPQPAEEFPRVTGNEVDIHGIREDNLQNIEVK